MLPGRQYQAIRRIVAIVKPVRKAQSARHFPISLTVVSVSAFMKKMKATTRIVTIATTTARAKCMSACISSTPWSDEEASDRETEIPSDEPHRPLHTHLHVGHR